MSIFPWEIDKGMEEWQLPESGQACQRCEKEIDHCRCECPKIDHGTYHIALDEEHHRVLLSVST